MKNLRLRKFLAVLPLFAAYSLLTSTGKAQAAAATTTTTTTTTTASTVANADEPQVLEKYVVTGSNIPMAAEALSIPVAVIDKQVIDNSGVSGDTLDILRKVAPNISGVGQENAQIQTGNNFGGASVNIKGLSTLVLIDGRRVATSPAEATGGAQFVDVNLIPPAAIERIEVLQDGASAIYGSDAVGGVINIILKKNYNGWEMGAHYGISTESGRYEERTGYLVGGVSTDTSSIMVALDYHQHNNLYLASRPFTNPIYGTYTSGGVLENYDNGTGDDEFYWLAPGINAPPGGGQYTLQQLIANGTYVPHTADETFQHFNLAKGETLIGALKRYSATINMEHKIFGDHLVTFGSIMASNTKTWSSLNAQPLVPFVSDPYTDVYVNIGETPPPPGVTYVPYTAPTNPFSQAYLDQAGDGVTGEGVYARERIIASPRVYQNDSTLYRLVGGLRGDVNDDLHWEGAVNINRYQLNYTNPGLYDTNALIAALGDGQINPFAVQQAPGALNGVVGTAFVNMLSTLNQFDFKVDGTPFDLPGGKLGFAVGASYVRESLSAVPDINSLPNSTGTTQGWSNATTFKTFTAIRDVSSVYGEVNVPVTGPKQEIPWAHSLNVDAALRYDDYNGAVGSTTTPEVNVSWAPVDDSLKFRASAGKSFIAPPLFELYGPQTAGSTSAINYTTTGGVAKKNIQFNETGGANPNLAPQKARSWTAGFVYTPKQLNGLSITVDYSQIEEKGLVGTVPASTIIQSVETNGTSSPYVADVHYNTPNGSEVSGPGGISNHSPQQIYVIQNLLNLGGQNVNSTDIQIEYKWNTANMGRFDLSSTWTWYNKYQLQLIPSEQFYNYNGLATVNEGTIPKWRTYSTAEWKLSGVTAVVGLTWVDSVTDNGTGGDSVSGLEHVGSFTAIDLSLSYDFGHLHLNKLLDGVKVTAGVNNVANRLPPLAESAFPDTNADVGTYDGAIGRMWFVDIEAKF